MDFFYVIVLYLSYFYAASIEWFLDFKFVACNTLNSKIYKRKSNYLKYRWYQSIFIWFLLTWGACHHRPKIIVN